jgi:DNA-binding response OmpR family regulator
MVIPIVIVTIVVFIIVDLLLRMILKRIDQGRLKRKRAEALDIGLRLEVSQDAPSLKTVEVDNPRARILAVDDEPIILDSFRKILVMQGYSVSTVENGREALGLIGKNEYDFVFTDLKMPEFDGLELTKAVKHMRPDIDVIMITGYATIQTAVDAMKHGALDYVEKPFTEDELTAFVNKALIRRQDRIEKMQPAKVHVVTAATPETASDRVFNVPAGVFISPAHVWARIEMTGEVRTGIDDFARKTIGQIDDIVLPKPGKTVKKGEALFTIKQNDRRLTIPAPLTGRIVAVHPDIEDHVEYLKVNPYEIGWICRIAPESLATELDALRIGSGAVAWYHEEIERLRVMVDKIAERKSRDGEPAAPPDGNGMSEDLWEAFSRSFLHV